MVGRTAERVVLVGGSDRLEVLLTDAGFDVAAVDAASRCLDVVERDDVDGVASAYDLPDLDRRDDGRVVVRIADDGPGIPDIERRSLHLDEDIDQLHHSSGLGLLFVSWVVRLSDGTLGIETKEPRGSVITLTLPAAESA
jgi:signal transduction histidine kinase